MKYQYAYLFTIGSKIVWSGETKESLLNRVGTDRDRELILDFTEKDHPGSFIELSTGEFVFQTS
jgi:hypothetical protein